VLLIVRDLQHVQSSADYNEDSGYMLVQFDNNLTLFHGAISPMGEHTSLLP
jgi:beta-lactamase superfamily II metal-dependent hydrolase